MTDWRDEFFDFGDAVYLNVAAQAPIPRVAAKALETAAGWKKLPHEIPDAEYFGLPDRVRALLARMLGGKPQEFAITTGASAGLVAAAMGIDFKPDDEVLLARGEFPAHVTTWAPLAAAGRLRVKTVSPADRFITADDFLAQIGPRTRLVSVSLVRFDDAARLDAARVAAACHSAGAFLLLDVSQCAGAMPLDVAALGADFLVCAGYKWLLGPYGTGFFWVREDLIDRMRPGPFYWKALPGAENFHSLHLDPSRAAPLAAHARRWDAPETSSFFNLSALEASLELILRAGVEAVWQHNARLISAMIARLPLDRCVLASPRDPAARGPYACVAARSPEKTAALYEKLRARKIFVSLREGALRVAPYLFNTLPDVDRFLEVIT